MCSDGGRAAGLEARDHAGLLDLLEHTLAALDEWPLDATVDDTELAASVEQLHRIETIAAAQKLRRIAAIDTRQTWRVEGARSTADLVAQRLHLTRGEAKAQTETAVALESLPATAAALRAGQVGLGQAQVAARAAAEVRPDVREELDRLVAADGARLDRRQLREHVNTWTQTADPDALAARERRAWERRRVSITADTPDGMVHGEFRLDPVGGATVIAALDAQSRKASDRDDRSFTQRQADALVALAQRALDAGELPQVAAQRPHVIMITHTGPNGELTKARLDGVGPVSDQTAQLISCDAEMTEVIVHRNGAVLDAGRTRRTPTRAQRAAVIARDQVCVGCGAPAARCQIHHVRWWTRDHGPTDEDNLCLTCWGCHAKIHHDHWLVVRDPDTGRFASTRPTRLRHDGDEPADPYPDPAATRVGTSTRRHTCSDRRSHHSRARASPPPRRPSATGPSPTTHLTGERISAARPRGGDVPDPTRPLEGSLASNGI